jgi:hypothetical protein
MYRGDNMKHTGECSVAGDISIPVALKKLEHSELYARRKAHLAVESCGSLNLARSMADALYDYDTVDSTAFGGSNDALVQPPALPPKKTHSMSKIITAQFR